MTRQGLRHRRRAAQEQGRQWKRSGGQI